ncbi:MAG: hypothetical protein ACLP50_00385 [Solirubrobacteraceae bacterium]
MTAPAPRPGAPLAHHAREQRQRRRRRPGMVAESSPEHGGPRRPQDQPKRSHAEATAIPTITGGDDRRLSGDIKLDGAPWVSWRKHPQLA